MAPAESESANRSDGGADPSPAPPPPFSVWQERILYPTLFGGIIGGAAGLVSKHRKTHGLGNISSTYATNLAIVSGCYCGAREFVRVSRKSEPDDLLNSAIAGFGTGAILGRLQGGKLGAIRYSMMFAIAGTAYDYAAIQLPPVLKSYRDSVSIKDLRLPEWFPIQILDEEQLAAKREREQQLAAAQRAISVREK